MAATGLDGVVRLYDIYSQRKLLEYYIGCGPVWDQCVLTELPRTFSSSDALISTHDVLVSGGDDGSVRVVFVPHDLSYATSSSLALVEHIVLRAGKQRVMSVAAQVSSDGKNVWIWAGSQDGHLYRWDLTVGGQHASGLTPKSVAPTTSIDLPRGVLPWSLQIYNTHAMPGQVLSTAPHTLLLGDSEGHLTVWDGAMGVLTQTLIHHKADILKLVLSPSNGSLFSVGVDNTISLFQRSSNTTVLGSSSMDVDGNMHSMNPSSNSSYASAAPWVFVAQRRSHTHDILAAVAGSHCLYSGGIDTKLMVHEYQDQLKLPGRAYLPFPQRADLVASLTHGTPSKRDRMVVQLDNRLQIWRLGKPLKNGNIDPKTNHHDILEEQALLLDITPKVNGRIQCHASSSRAHRLAFSDNTHTKVFCIRERGSSSSSPPLDSSSPSSNSNNSHVNHHSTSLQHQSQQQMGGSDEDKFLAAFSDPVLNVEKKLTIKGPSSILLFTSNGILVRATPNTHLIQTWDVSDPDRPSLLHTFHEHSHKPRQSQISTKASASSSTHRGQQFASSSTESLLRPINAMVCSPCGKYLASSDLHNRVFVFSLETNQLIYSLPPFEDQITAMVFDPEESHLAVALTSNRFWIYNIESKSITEWSRAHGNDLPDKLTDAQERIIGMVFHPSVPGMLFLYGHTFIFYAQTAGSGNRIWKMIKAYQPLFVDFVDEEGLVVIERPWLKVLQHLPPPFYRQRFGT